MLTFLVEESIISTGALSGIFTVSLLNSFKVNILEPCVEKIAPSHKFKKDNFMPMINIENKTPNKNIEWRLFIRDFIIWLVVMSIVYILWKFMIHPVKKNKI